MRAWLVDPPGGPGSLRLVDLPGPRRATGGGMPGPEVVVRVEAVALDAADALPNRDHRGAHVPGVDVAGRVVTVRAAPGDDLPESAPRPGARVACHLPPRRGGGFAQQVAVPIELVAPVPIELDAIAAASMVTPGLTALEAVERRLRQVAGNNVLVTGADTPVGLWSVQLARLFGATVIAMAEPGHEPVVRGSGAMHVMHPDEPGTDSALAALSPGGVDNVIDTVSAGSATAGLAQLRLGGHLVALAGRPDLSVASDLSLLPTISEVSLGAVHESGGTSGMRWLRWGLERLMHLVCEGHLVPPEIEVVDFEEIPASLARLSGATQPARLVANLRWGRWASQRPGFGPSGAVRLT